MTLASFAASVDFSKSSLSSEDIPVERSDNTGTAKLFEAQRRGVGLSSAAAELRKTFCVKKSTSSEKLDSGTYCANIYLL